MGTLRNYTTNGADEYIREDRAVGTIITNKTMGGWGGGAAGGADGACGWPDGQGQLRRGARPQPSRAHCLAFLFVFVVLPCVRLFATTKDGTTGATLLGCFVQLLSGFSMATSLVVHLTRFVAT